ncbi:cytospin-B isoform X1 [Lonchura striata]|uniref:Cytospin-B n=1 Tax=Lonchura striata TaxID=40157 RepID=A0A218UVH2_9PASE|nr:cytospin-B isoform X1 [Lonchura striata domestica]XP_021380618.1 cytospin-B isoform X1 [Lonchura striata domestica]XP_021380619.1 cytospin-B isoform X1 [Lonchura striata domestica]XP_021380620.1 cytospin-B isoform X1 [Lonchura striata domestica]OWK57342.1 Cytospin-B [Lonchura striata domestica]
MKSSARPWSTIAKQGSHGVDRGKPLSTTSTGMKTSKSSTSLAFESRLSKLKRASSEDMLTKPGPAAAAGVSRLKKTITTGAISELAESRLRPSTGAVSAAKRTGIPAPRELSSSVSRERAVLRGQANTRKTQPSPTSSGAPTPTKHVRPTSKSKQENETGDKAVLESQVKELLAEAKTKDSEITKLRSELKKCKEKGSLNAEGMGASNQNLETVSPVDIDPLIRTLQEKNRTFQKELASLGEENRALKEKLLYLENSPLSDTTTSSGGDSSLPTPTTQESSFGSPSKSASRGEAEERRQHLNGGALRNSGSSSSDVTKASLSPDASDFEHIADVPSRPASASSNHFKGSKCSTAGSSPNNISDLSVASLTERIQKMEENHHSTAEELQATLQELSDQQQMVQELTTENEKLVEEKALLETSFRQHRDRAEQLSQENEKLMTLLQERSKNEAQEEKVLELEQKCTEVLEKAQFEREKLLNIQQQLTSSLRSLEREHQDAQQVIKSLKEENEKLLKLLEVEQQSNSTVTKSLEDCKIALEGLKIENGSLKTQLENEKQKAAEINVMGCTSDNSEVQEMLKVAHAEKAQLEASCTELKQELLKANSELKHIQGLLSKAENEYGQLKEVCDRQAEQLSRTSQKLQEKTSENEADIKNLKETIFELEDQVEQHRAIKLHNNQLISDLESKAMKLEEQKQDTERQLKALTKQMKEDTEEWRRFQADLQTAVVVANDIKCEAQQELRVVKRKLQEEEEKSARLQKELDEVKGSNRLAAEEVDSLESDTASRWQGVCLSRASPTPPESAATVKSLIKSFDLGCSGSSGQNIPVHKVPRSPLSGIPVRTAPAAAVSPMQRHSVYSNAKPASKGIARHADLSDLPLADLLKGRNEELKPDHYLRKSPSLESLSKPPMAFSSRMLSSTPSCLKPQSKLSVERKDPLAALAREYGGSKRNALLKWCQKKTEGYQNIDITNFSSSWSDGLAFCALLHTYLPAHIPYQELNSQDKKRNLLLAFQAAESVGIKPSLELSEMMYTDRPDWQSVMQYVAQIYKYFET